MKATNHYITYHNVRILLKSRFWELNETSNGVDIGFCE